MLKNFYSLPSSLKICCADTTSFIDVKCPAILHIQCVVTLSTKTKYVLVSRVFPTNVQNLIPNSTVCEAK